MMTFKSAVNRAEAVVASHFLGFAQRSAVVFLVRLAEEHLDGDFHGLQRAPCGIASH